MSTKSESRIIRASWFYRNLGTPASVLGLLVMLTSEWVANRISVVTRIYSGFGWAREDVSHYLKFFLLIIGLMIIFFSIVTARRSLVGDRKGDESDQQSLGK
jgi:hypothetical protein